MKTVEKIASTVENAIESGLLELGINREQAKIEVLEEEGRRGFLGLFGMKMARVRISTLESIRDSIASAEGDRHKSGSEEAVGDLACKFLQELIEAMDIKASFEVVKNEDQHAVNISGEELGMLIGRRGDTLEAIQYLTNLAISKMMNERKRVIVDIEGYRKRREETLSRLANKLADKARKTGSRVVLEPMSPQERRMIHVALQEDATVSTYSEGQEPNRRVVISPKRAKI
ncbi:MAG: protein jag [Peptococcaceae bacterium]|nr:protein jag [Peptococcaceae bacterium]